MTNRFTSSGPNRPEEAGEIVRDLFHCCALTAFVRVAAQTRQWPPDSELTRRLAYSLYEAELAKESADGGRDGGT